MEPAGCSQPSDPLGKAQNSFGGHPGEVTEMARLRRFLCYGSEGPMYSTKEHPLGMENSLSLIRLIEDGHGCEAVEEIRQFGVEGRTVRANPTLFALAVCSHQSDARTKQAAFKVLRDLCRTPSQLFSFVQYKKELKQGAQGGMWGRALRKAVSDWYNSQEAASLAQAVTVCKHSAGWSHQDLLRLSHMKPANDAIALITKYITKGWKEVQETYADKDHSEEIVNVLSYLGAVEKAKHTTDALEVIHLIEEHKLQREQILTSHLKSKEVLKALLKEIPVSALVRHLGKMTADRVLAAGSPDIATVCERIQDETLLNKAKMHPFSVFVAMENYKRGHGNRGKLRWEPIGDIVCALESAFSKCIADLETTGKRYVIGVDVSASLSSTALGSSVNAATAAAAMTMIIARTEKDVQVLVYSEGVVVPCTISEDMTLMQVTAELIKIPFGSTDCALPILWATENEKPVDIFIVFTNNETWFGNANPADLLRMHREKLGVFSKLIVCGMTTNNLSIADPEDRGMLDICGFDTRAVDVIHNFVLDLI